MEEKKEIVEIVEKAIKENNWEKLSSKEYEGFQTVTEIAEKITLNGKKVKPEEINDILEEMELCKRIDKKVILTEKGKQYGRYVICIHLLKDKPIVTDKGYVKYKIEVKELIEKFIAENPEFIINKRQERNNKRNETRKKNKEMKENKEDK